MEAFNVTRYRSRDGQEFDLESECKAWERKHAGTALVGLSIEEIEAARTRSDPALADAFEAFAGQIRRARIAKGEVKRVYKKKSKAGEPLHERQIDIAGTATPAEHAAALADPRTRDKYLAGISERSTGDVMRQLETPMLATEDPT